MKTMLEVDERHWWYRGRRRIIRAELDRLPLPRGARVLDAGCGSGRTLEELAALRRGVRDRARPGGGRGGARRGGAARSRSAGSRSCRGRRDTFDLITCLDVIEHTPDDRVDAARAAAGVQAGRLAARDRAGLSGAVVAARRGQPPLPPLRPPHAARGRRARRAGGSQRMTSFNSLLLAPAAAVRLAQRRRPPAGRDYKPDLELGPGVAQRRARAAAAARGAVARARAHAAGRAVAAGGARRTRRTGAT